MAAKDFGLIAGDYEFFMAHSTEATSDIDAYVRELAGYAGGRSSIRLLDFGCGTGEFTERLLARLNWPPRVLELALVEPVVEQRAAAARRLAPRSGHAIEQWDSLTSAQAHPVDLVLGNHVLYYVDDLEETLRLLSAALRPGGKLLLAIAGWDNALMHFWQLGFALLGTPVPYFAADDVETALRASGAAFQRTQAGYRLRFADSRENRLKILRFLLAEHLNKTLAEGLLPEFNRYVDGDAVDVKTFSFHFVVEPAESSAGR